MKTIMMATGALAALALAAGSANASMTWVATGSGPDGPESASAVISITGNQLSVDLTSLINSSNGASKLSDGEQVSGIELFFGSAPGSLNGFSQSGTLIDIQSNGTVNPVSGSPDHWSDALNGTNLTIATVGIKGGKPQDLIIGHATSYPTVNASVIQHQPEIDGTGSFIVDFASALQAQVTAVKIQFGTGPTSLDAVCTAGCGNAVPEPATWAMMLVGFLGLGAMLRSRRAKLARTVA